VPRSRSRPRCALPYCLGSALRTSRLRRLRSACRSARPRSHPVVLAEYLRARCGRELESVRHWAPKVHSSRPAAQYNTATTPNAHPTDPRQTSCPKSNHAAVTQDICAFSDTRFIAPKSIDSRGGLASRRRGRVSVLGCGRNSGKPRSAGVTTRRGWSLQRGSRTYLAVAGLVQAAQLRVGAAAFAPEGK